MTIYAYEKREITCDLPMVFRLAGEKDDKDKKDKCHIDRDKLDNNAHHGAMQRAVDNQQTKSNVTLNIADKTKYVVNKLSD